MPDATPEKRKTYSPELKARCFDLYCSDIPLTVISDKLDVALMRLQQWSCNEKWKKKRLQVMAAKQAGTFESTPPAVPVPSLTLTEMQNEYEARMQSEAITFARELALMPESLKLASADKIEKRDKIARKALKLETDKPRTIINIGLLAGHRPPKPMLAASELPTTEALTYEEATGIIPVAQPLTDGESIVDAIETG